jgi:hypothetical protein
MERFRQRHERNVDHFLGREKGKRRNANHNVANRITITFAVGGAGAQQDIGRAIALSLREWLDQGKVQLNLVAGVRHEVRSAFQRLKQELLPGCPNVTIVYGASKSEYFREFSSILHQTDVLWTKPSELSFYCGLGIPIVFSPSIGSQEEFNRKWLLEIGAGVPQEDPAYTSQWLFDYLTSGRLAEIAWNGFLNARKYGTYNIEKILEGGIKVRESSRSILQVA